MNFIGDSECDDTNHREAHAFECPGRLPKRSIEKNPQDAIFEGMQNFITKTKKEGREVPVGI